MERRQPDTQRWMRLGRGQHGGAVRGAGLLAVVCGLAVFLAACGGSPSSTTPPPAPSIVSVGAGNDHSLAIDDAGNVWAWGSDSNGQLGNGTTSSAVATPHEIGGLANATAIAGGDSDSFALRTDGTVWAWGYNSYGELGDGTIMERHSPVQVLGAGGSGHLTGVVAIAAGAQHVLALKNDGSVWAWGNNAYGQLGDGTGTDRHAPVQVAGLSNVIAIAAGRHHSLAVKSDGSVWAWGDNSFGQLGDGTTVTSTTPVAVEGVGGSGTLAGIIAVAAGTDHSLALGSGGAVYAWGGNAHGQLGDGSTSQSTVPVRVAAVGGTGTLAGIMAIAAGSQDSVALGTDGVVRAWGYNFAGKLGDGTTIDRPTPVEVGSLTNVTVIAAGGAHSLARVHGGIAYAWGNNLFGQLAIATTTLQRTTPARVGF